MRRFEPRLIVSILDLDWTRVKIENYFSAFHEFWRERDAEHFQDPEIYFRRCYKYISRQKQCVVPSRGLDQTLHKETVKRPKRKP